MASDRAAKNDELTTGSSGWRIAAAEDYWWYQTPFLKLTQTSPKNKTMLP